MFFELRQTNQVVLLCENNELIWLPCIVQISILRITIAFLDVNILNYALERISMIYGNKPHFITSVIILFNLSGGVWSVIHRNFPHNHNACHGSDISIGWFHFSCPATIILKLLWSTLNNATAWSCWFYIAQILYLQVGYTGVKKNFAVRRWT